MNSLSSIVRTISRLKWNEAGARKEVSFEELVQHAYRGVLKRDAEAKGIEIYSNALRNGMSLSDLIAELASTPEFLSKLAPGLNNGAGEAGELRRLAAAMERAMLTLAIGAAGQRRAAFPEDRHVPIMPALRNAATS